MTDPPCPKCGKPLTTLRRIAFGVQPLDGNDYSPRDLVILKHVGCGQQVYTSEYVARRLTNALP